MQKLEGRKVRELEDGADQKRWKGDRKPEGRNRKGRPGVGGVAAAEEGGEPKGRKPEKVEGRPEAGGPKGQGKISEKGVGKRRREPEAGCECKARRERTRKRKGTEGRSTTVRKRLGCEDGKPRAEDGRPRGRAFGEEGERKRADRRSREPEG